MEGEPVGCLCYAPIDKAQYMLGEYGFSIASARDYAVLELALGRRPGNSRSMQPIIISNHFLIMPDGRSYIFKNQERMGCAARMM